MGRNGPINSKISCHELASEVYAPNAPDPPHWTPNSTFVTFRSVWVHLGPFRYCMKLGVKWAELVQLIQKVHATKSFPNFSQRMQLIHPHWNLKSCFVLFRSVWVHLGPFRCFTILGSNHAELLQSKQKFKPQSCVRIFLHQIHPIHAIWS